MLLERKKKKSELHIFERRIYFENIAVRYFFFSLIFILKHRGGKIVFDLSAT